MNKISTRMDRIQRDRSPAESLFERKVRWNAFGSWEAEMRVGIHAGPALRV